MDSDDLEPQAKPAKGFVEANVEALAIAELHAYIAHLESEIERARTEIAAKGALRGDAESLFK